MGIASSGVLADPFEQDCSLPLEEDGGKASPSVGRMPYRQAPSPLPSDYWSNSMHSTLHHPEESKAQWPDGAADFVRGAVIDLIRSKGITFPVDHLDAGRKRRQSRAVYLSALGTVPICRPKGLSGPRPSLVPLLPTCPALQVLLSVFCREQAEPWHRNSSLDEVSHCPGSFHRSIGFLCALRLHDLGKEDNNGNCILRAPGVDGRRLTHVLHPC